VYEDPGLQLDASATVTFVLAWYFPNLHHDRYKRVVGRHYATRFDSARTVADYVAKNFERLERETRLWRDTWYDSTLPFWLPAARLANNHTLTLPLRVLMPSPRPPYTNVRKLLWKDYRTRPQNSVRNGLYRRLKIQPPI